MNRAELIKYAEQHKNDVLGVKPILTAIMEAMAHIQEAAHCMESLHRMFALGIRDFHADADFVVPAVKIREANAKLCTLFLTLACVLNQAGHKINY